MVSLYHCQYVSEKSCKKTYNVAGEGTFVDYTCEEGKQCECMNSKCSFLHICCH